MAKKKKEVVPDQDQDQLDQLKAKLKAKYWLLRNEPLEFDTKDALLSFVSDFLGIGRPNLDVIIGDL
jgi:hypothetical protein